MNKRAVAKLLWTMQILLALLFLFAAAAKLIMPIETLSEQVGLPGSFLQFISLAEILGSFGLVLPGLFRIRTGLTPLAASGLVIIMIGATVITARTMGMTAAFIPLGTGLLSAFVAYGRYRIAPLPERKGH